MDVINEYLLKCRNHKRESAFGYLDNVYPKMICKDGFEISVQASMYHYCIPRANGYYKYEKVELGFPNCEEPLIADYAEDPDNLTDTVYGYVPVDLVAKVVEKHGGIIN